MKTTITTKFNETDIEFIPKEWISTDFGKILSLEYGQALKEEKRVAGEFPVYGSNGVVGFHNEKLVDGPGIIVGRKGSAGEIIYSTKDFFAIDTTYFVKTTLNKEFVYYLLKNSNIKRLVGSSAVPGLNRNDLYSQKIVIPAKHSEQKQIAQTLSCIDEKIELNRRLNTNLENLSATLFKKWFIDINTESERWKMVSFTDVVDIMSGGTPKTNEVQYWNGDIPFFTPKDASDITYTLWTEKNMTQTGLDNCNSPLYPANTTFITARGTVGKVAMAGVPMAMNQSCYALKGKQGIGPYFVYELAKKTAEELKQKAHGSVFSTITIATFSQVSFPLPDSELLKKYELVVSPLFETIKANERENIKLALIRDSLLPRLMSGKIRVKI